MIEARELLKGTTPGPWVLKDRDQQLHVVLPNGDYFFVDDLDQITEEERANARLVAAAPEMARELAEARAELSARDAAYRLLKAAFAENSVDGHQRRVDGQAAWRAALGELEKLPGLTVFFLRGIDSTIEPKEASR